MNPTRTAAEKSTQTRTTVQDSEILPIDTESLCPQCLLRIPARINEEAGKVFMHKSCPEHGAFRELISSDAAFYKLMIQRDKAIPRGISNPVEQIADCPNGCGICPEHRSSPIMINVDLTNRCNLNCPICFANSNKRREVVELSMDQLRHMLDASCSLDEVQPACLQYTGGEPTVHPRFLEALREGKKRNFAQIQVATNGLAFANNPQFAYQASEAGLNIAYLQFDGIDDEIYKKTRGRPLFEKKIEAIDNLYAAGIRSVLVPTVVKGVNDHQIGDIIRFAIDNIEKITGISWQPIAFTGRFDYQQRLAQRYTIADLARDIHEQTGLMDMYRDWYPFGFADPFSRLLEAVRKKKQTRLGCSPTCGAASYLIVNQDNHEAIPIPAFLDVEPLMDKLTDIAAKVDKKLFFRKLSMVRELRSLDRFFHSERAPKGWKFKTFVNFMMDFVDFRKRHGDNKARQERIEKSPYKALLIASMHFQDAYNYQIDRVQRCVIHYAAPNGRVYPFCSYNSGPCHRNRIEKQYAVPLEEYHKNTH